MSKKKFRVKIEFKLFVKMIYNKNIEYLIHIYVWQLNSWM